MKVSIDAAELLRVMNRHKAKTLGALEEINCPDGYKTIVRNGLDYLRSDIVSLTSHVKG